MMTYIQVKNSFKRYQVGETEIIANHDVNFDIEKGEFVIILGASGAGKSTVLNILVISSGDSTPPFKIQWKLIALLL